MLLAPAARLDTMPGGELLRAQDKAAFAAAVAHAPQLTLGWEAYRWAVKYLFQPNGPKAGQRYQPTMRQLLFWLHWYGLNPDGTWIYSSSARRLSKGAGKSPFAASTALVELCAPVRLRGFDPRRPGGVIGKPVSMPWVQIAAVSEAQPLALDTPVRTTVGWSTIGDLRVGDLVFSSTGQPVPVERLTPVAVNEPCYRVNFDDGESIVASGRHSWTVERRNGHDNGWETVTLTTDAMAGSIARHPRRRLRVPTVAVSGEKRHLNVHPYLLGLWLGDGTSANGSIAFDARLRTEVERTIRLHLEPWEDLHFEAVTNGHSARVNIKRRDGICPRGHEYFIDESNRYAVNGFRSCRKCNAHPRAGRADAHKPSMRERLRSVGVLGDKHIPDDYLQSTYADRMALLRGLVDSDGSIEPKGRANFTNKNARLMADVCDLLSSLGFKWAMTNADGGARRVHFMPRNGEPVATLRHKVERHIDADRQMSTYRRVVSVTVTESVPVRCIGIDTSDHLFMVGRRGVLTHNCENTMRMVRSFARKGSRVVADHHLDPGLKLYHKLDDGGRLEIVTNSAASAEGAEATFVVADEVEHWLGSAGAEFLNTLADNVAKSGNRLLETCNSWKPGIGSVAEATWNDFVSQEERIAAKGDTKSGSRILYDARIAPLDTDLADLDSLMRALNWVYDDCWWIDPKAYIPRIWRKSAKEDDSKRKYLNWPTVPEGAWIDVRDWILLASDGVDGRPLRKLVDGERIVLFLDASKSRDATALVGCCLSDGHVFTIRVWEPKVKTAKVVDENGNSLQADSAQIDFVEVDNVVSATHERFEVIAFWSDVREVEGFAKVTWPERWSAQYDRKYWAVRSGQTPEPIAWDMRTKSRDFALAAEQVQAEIEGGMFTHDGNPVTTRHIANCRKADTKWGAVTVSKETPTSLDKIDAAVCVIGARLLYKVVISNAQPDEPSDAFFYSRWG